MIYTENFWNLNLLWDASLLIAVIAIILLVSSELLSSYGGRANILINKKRLRNASIAATMTFIVTAAMRILYIIMSP